TAPNLPTRGAAADGVSPDDGVAGAAGSGPFDDDDAVVPSGRERGDALSWAVGPLHPRPHGRLRLSVLHPLDRLRPVRLRRQRARSRGGLSDATVVQRVVVRFVAAVLRQSARVPLPPAV